MRAIALALAACTIFVPLARVGDLPTREGIADGWIALFDGKTTSGWTRNDGKITVEDGALMLLGKSHKAMMKPTYGFTTFALKADCEARAEQHSFATVVRTSGRTEVIAGIMTVFGSMFQLTVLEAAGNGLTARISSKVGNEQDSSANALIAQQGPRDGRYPALVFLGTVVAGKIFLRKAMPRSSS